MRSGLFAAEPATDYLVKQHVEAGALATFKVWERSCNGFQKIAQTDKLPSLYSGNCQANRQALCGHVRLYVHLFILLCCVFNGKMV